MFASISLPPVPPCGERYRNTAGIHPGQGGQVIFRVGLLSEWVKQGNEESPELKGSHCKDTHPYGCPSTYHAIMFVELKI